jgi:hypothetical protein
MLEDLFLLTFQIPPLVVLEMLPKINKNTVFVGQRFVSAFDA